MIFNMDCIQGMKNIPDKSVDLMICDLPYGETNCSWDTIIPMEEFWTQFKRIRKSDRVACIHFCSTKFGYSLIKSWEKGFKMDMVWKKRNKTGGLLAKYRPMRNHEMVYFFYDKCPKYNRDKYHKRLLAPQKIIKCDKGVWGVKWDQVEGEPTKFGMTNGITYEPKLPTSVMPSVNEVPEEKDPRIDDKGKSPHGWDIKYMDTERKAHFDPALPTSVMPDKEEKNYLYGAASSPEQTKKEKDKRAGEEKNYTPLLPTSVLEEDKPTLVIEEKKVVSDSKKATGGLHWSLKKKEGDFVYSQKGYKHGEGQSSKEWREHMKKEGITGSFEPTHPVSVYEGEEEKEPASLYESEKVFIGKRNHQTEKPLDILEFFLKYYTDEGDTVLDPTMGSGSTGVACNNIKRNFIGFELNESIFKTALKRISTDNYENNSNTPNQVEVVEKIIENEKD